MSVTVQFDLGYRELDIHEVPQVRTVSNQYCFKSRTVSNRCQVQTNQSRTETWLLIQ